MTDWIRLDAKKFNQEEDRSSEDVSVVVSLPPNAIPQDVRSRKIESGHLVIDFRYRTWFDEPEEEFADNGVTLRYGKNSKRLYKVVFDPEVLASGPRETEFERLLRETTEEFSKRMNFGTPNQPSAAREVILAHEAQLLHAS